MNAVSGRPATQPGASPHASSRHGAVLITGASSGIGYTCARGLARKGFHIFAGVRRTEDGERLRAANHEHITPIFLDVTDADSIAAAVATVTSAAGDAGLKGLVNNAGIAVAGPMEFVSLDDLRRQLEINVTGQVAVTQAFMPLIRRGRGRLVFMSSIAGQMAPPMLGPYAASKHAIEAIADAMRVELHEHGIRVAIIEPGAVRSSIWEKGLAAAEARAESLPPEGHAYYDDMIDRLTEHARRQAADAIPPGHVAGAVHHALTSRRPRARYIVGTSSHISVMVQRWLPSFLRDRLVRWRLGI